MTTLDQILKPRQPQQQPQPVFQHLPTPPAAPAATNPAAITSPVTQTKTTPQQQQTTPKETCRSQTCFYLPNGYNIGQCTPSGLYIPIDLAKQTKLCTNPKTPYHNHQTPTRQKGVNKHNN